MSTGRLFGVGLGPGDPELVTVKARRIVEAVDVVAYPCARPGSSVARRIAEPYLRCEQIEVPMTFPVTTGETKHPGGYEGALSDFYDRAARELAGHLEDGRDVAVLCEGDPLFYGSYMYIHDRLAHRFTTEVVPGVTSFSAAAAAAGVPLARRDDVFTVFPGTLPEEELAAGLRSSDAAVVLKLGRTFERVREAARQAGAQARGIFVERASTRQQRVLALEDVQGEVPYMSLLLLPTRSAGPRRAAGEVDMGEMSAGAAGAAAGVAARTAAGGRVSVVGLGPAGPQWLTPEAKAELAEADELVGYDTYLARVPVRRGQGRHASDNRVEADRARHALTLAGAGARVAVVSSGDPGIFAMAAAVLEVAELEADRFADVEVRVVPGLSAMQAAAARVGAPLGHDFCVISLSDQLKPWEAVERRLDAAGAGDFALALYNPASRTRREQLARAQQVLLGHRRPSTPVVVARAVGAPQETVTITTLGDLPLELVDMRTLLIVGSSATRVVPGQHGRPRVYTPRRYSG